MILTSLFTVVLVTLGNTVMAQDDTKGPIIFDAIHNATTIYGSWSSGSKQVLTGPGFANPANMTFIYPKTTGVSYSFTTDGYYEIARYRFNGNGSEPTCITGAMGWVHGKYSLNANGSITMVPFADGFQQIQDPCAAETNFIESFTLTEYYKGWRIFQDPIAGFKLHLFLWDGSPVAPMFQISTTPTVHPTRLLRNVSTDAVELTRRSISSAEALNPGWMTAVLGVVGSVVAAATTML